jgi:PD-(D/E)XK nuclease superfamily
MPRTGKLIKALRTSDIEEFISIFNTIFATIPSQIFIAEKEAYYHAAIVFLTLQLIGLNVRAEVSQAKGRADAVIFLESAIYILEFKLDESAEVALQQIKDKEYATPYMHESKEIYLLGLNMTSKDKKITSFAIEKMDISHRG